MAERKYSTFPSPVPSLGLDQSQDCNCPNIFLNGKRLHSQACEVMQEELKKANELLEQNMNEASVSYFPFRCMDDLEEE